MTWSPIWTLPNIDLDEPIETEYFALVPNGDPRVRALTRRHPEFRKFMARFYDTFRNRINPALIIRRDDVPTRLRAHAVAPSFRDLVAASTVPYARSKNIANDNARVMASYSSYFWVYPWMITADYQDIVAFTPAMWALHQPQAFKGQSSPDLSPLKLHRRDFDEPLLRELEARLVKRYGDPNPSWQDFALFRSLTIANRASLIPAGADATIHDLGIIAGLWVAAFEILVHPGEQGQTHIRKVFELLEGVPWINRKCTHRRFETGTKNRSARRNLACWIYNELYSCRNAFLHGNLVRRSSLKIRRSGRNLIDFGPTLYRLGLTSSLGLSWKRLLPPEADAEEIACFNNELMNFNNTQRQHENALQLALISEVQQRRQRQERLQAMRGRIRAGPT